MAPSQQLDDRQKKTESCFVLLPKAAVSGTGRYVQPRRSVTKDLLPTGSLLRLFQFFLGPSPGLREDRHYAHLQMHLVGSLAQSPLTCYQGPDLTKCCIVLSVSAGFGGETTPYHRSGPSDIPRKGYFDWELQWGLTGEY